ncbi:MAG: 23S rRNA (adenine(2503)-C(2))-methyltransferase RlmN [Acidobacteriota bacterium]
MSSLPKTVDRINLVGRSSQEIADIVAPHVDRDFRCAQIARWVIDRNVVDFGDMTDLPADLRRDLQRRFRLEEPEVVQIVDDGDSARKFLFALGDGAHVEGVSMREGAKATLCLSSQAGCAVGCTFCVTGAVGAGRDLRADELVGQYRRMLRCLDKEIERVNIVFMGMGEPLLNTANLGPALEVLFERVSPKRVTVSTAGILPGIEWLGGLAKRPKLAVSLNAPDQKRRQQIMPISRRYPLASLLTALRDFPLEGGRRITFEYVLIEGFNDAVADAQATADLIRGIPAKINVIPLNEDEEFLPGLQRPPEQTVGRFAAHLKDAGLTVTVRWSKGTEVAAACGQLRGRGPDYS